MPESLWTQLDAWQVDHLAAEMGAASAYASLKAQTIVSSLIRDVNDWSDPAKWTFPALIVMGREIDRRPGPFGDGEIHLDKLYPYAWIGVVTGTQADATANAKILDRRLEDAARTLRQNLDQTPDDSGERLQDLNIEQTRMIIVRRRTSDLSDQWYGITALYLAFESKI